MPRREMSCPLALATVIAMALRRPEVAKDPAEALARCRMWLFGQGQEREAVLAVWAARGNVLLPEYLQLRVRYFADGAVLGKRAYVDGVFEALRNRWSPSRSDGARAMQGLSADLCVLRDLQEQVFG